MNGLGTLSGCVKQLHDKDQSIFVYFWSGNRNRDTNVLRLSTEGAEVCHLISIFFSILPVPIALLSDYLRPGMAAFAITSALALLFNLALIDIQRFNRYRIARIIRKTGTT